jgi:hypothetical protein
MPKLKFSLLQNGLDSLVQGVELALGCRDEQGRLKVAILLVAQAVELILKERLRREHWSLIFKRLETAGNENAHTVTVGQAVDRLRQIAGVVLSKQESAALDRLRRIRNQIQHYEIEISFEQALGQINEAIAFLVSFLDSELGIDIRELLEDSSYEELLEVERIVEELETIAQRRIEDVREEVLPFSASERAAFYFDVIECPRCWRPYYVFSPDADISECQLCGYDGGFVECARCAEAFPDGAWEINHAGGDIYFCNSCLSYIDAQ